jgi:hypothetical protein
MDYGYPQFTEAPILQEFIKTDSYRMEVREQPAGSAAAAAAAAIAGFWCMAPGWAVHSCICIAGHRHGRRNSQLLDS